MVFGYSRQGMELNTSGEAVKHRIICLTKWEKEMTSGHRGRARERWSKLCILQQAGLTGPGEPAVTSLYSCMSTCRIILSTCDG